MRHSMRFCALLLLLMLLPAVVPVSAQTPPPEITLETAWDRWFRAPGWVEVQATLTNENSNWEGELHILDANDQVTYRQPLVLPAHSHKFYRIPVFAQRTLTLHIVLRDANGKSEVVQDIALRSTGNQRLCVIADTTGLIKAQMLNGCGITLLIQDRTRLPETVMAWDAVSVLILNGVSTADLTPAQQEALLAWVGMGGHLILSGGAALPQTLAGLPQPLQIAAPGAIQVFDGLALSGQTFDGVSAGALTLSASATPLTTIAGTHLAARQTLGLGEVNVVGWDIVQTPSREWLQTLWGNDPIPAIQAPLAQDVSTAYGEMVITYSLFQVPQKSLPGLRRWLLLLPIYILVIGPGTWFIVRRLRRPSLAWVIIPGWIMLSLTFLALALNGQFSQIFPITHQVAHIFAPGDALPARVLQGAAMYAPRAQKLSWEMNGASRWLFGDSLSNTGRYARSSLEIRYQEDANRMQAARALGVITWGTEGLTTLPSLAADLEIAVAAGNDPVLVGTLRSELALTEVSLFLGDGRYITELTEDLAQGVTLDINQPMTQTKLAYTHFKQICRGSRYTSSTRRIAVSASDPSVYTNQLDDKPCYIAGMTQAVPFPIRDNGGTQVTESCILYAIPCPIQAHGNMKVALQAVAAQVEGGWIDEAGIVHVSPAGTTVPFVIPDRLQLQSMQYLTIGIQLPDWQSDAPVEPPGFIEKLSLWDWTNEEWMELPVQSDLTQLTKQQAERLYNVESGVKVHIRPKDPAGTDVVLAVSIKGSW